ncbi:HAD family phosphatase [Patescibacteria group bacterium]|nr:HAD family phosphatase [Patescibacteria group bacterium]
MSTKNNPNKKKIAVFDIDGTVFRSSLMMELLDALIIEGIFPARAKKIYEKEYHAWLNRKGSYEDYRKKFVLAYEKFIKGVKEEKVWEAARKVMAFHKNSVYRFTRELILKLKKTYYLLAISGSPRRIVKPFGDEFNFDKVYGCIFATDKNGRFTGQILYEKLISDKEKILTRAVNKGGFSLKGSIGVGDTETDIPFLELVEYPIAFNPNMELYQVALKKKWPIIVERKNVIYKIGGKNLPQKINNIIKNKFLAKRPK